MSPPRSLPELIEDSTAEVLLRVPPDEPAHLVRASLVCKLWRRILLDPAFHRRYREFHRIPPQLGFLRNSTTAGHFQSFRFVPTTSACPISQPPFDCAGWRALSCRHGRVLLDTGFYGVHLVVWDPITGDLRWLPKSSISISFYSSAAVLCTAGSCNHLDCHGGPFLVVSVSSHDGRPGELLARVGVYSSETGAWDTRAPLYRRSVIGFVDSAGVIFVKTDVGIFTMELKSGRKRKVRKVSKPEDCCSVIPFMSFYTPDGGSRKLQSPSETN